MTTNQYLAMLLNALSESAKRCCDEAETSLRVYGRHCIAGELRAATTAFCFSLEDAANALTEAAMADVEGGEG